MPITINMGTHILSQQIMDAGCGSGRDSKYFIEKGHKVLSVDASKTMCKLAENYIGNKVLRIRLEDLIFDNVFDGIWSCASLLHVSREKIKSVMENLYESLRIGGILYASFKYGSGEMFRDGRLFVFYDEKTLEELFKKHTSFQIVKMFKTEDVRHNHQNEYWINVIARKRIEK